MGSTDSLAGLARPLLNEAGLELWDIEVGPSVVRILVDRPQGVDLDALSAATRVLSPLLDQRDDLVPGDRYDLEVSSPGIERTLRTAEQYRRYIGSLLTMKTTVAIDGSRRFRATLFAVADDAIDVVVDGSSQPVTVPLDQIDRARTVLEWGPTPKEARPQPGKAKPGKAKQGKAKPGKAKQGKAKQGKAKQAASKQAKQSRSNRSPRLAEATSPGATDDKDSAS